ncbi:uncharacterized protein ACNLHF_011912 [Anomaloglossus baeobatrachus]
MSCGAREGDQDHVTGQPLHGEPGAYTEQCGARTEAEELLSPDLTSVITGAAQKKRTRRHRNRIMAGRSGGSLRQMKNENEDELLQLEKSLVLHLPIFYWFHYHLFIPLLWRH